MKLPLARRDSLPENASHPDTGCEVSLSCLACPLPMCKHDDPGWLFNSSRALRDEEIARRFNNGERVYPLAVDKGLSTRTIHRILQRERLGIVYKPDEDDEGQLMTLEQLGIKSLFKQRAEFPSIVPSSFDTRPSFVP